jgi:hypothetical protein
VTAGKIINMILTGLDASGGDPEDIIVKPPS